jgi:hypothetical protein
MHRCFKKTPAPFVLPSSPYPFDSGFGQNPVSTGWDGPIQEEAKQVREPNQDRHSFFFF